MAVPNLAEAIDLEMQDDADDVFCKESDDAPALPSMKIPLIFCLRYLETKSGRSRLVRDSMIYLPFLVMFVIFATAGRDVTEDYYVDRVLRDLVLGNEIAHDGSAKRGAPAREVQKTFVEIRSVQDWYDWMETVLLPNLWSCSNTTKGVEYLQQQGLNYLVGALRFRTLRANRRSCEPDSIIFLKDQNGSGGAKEVPPTCDDIPGPTAERPDGNLWQPPVFAGLGQEVTCFRVTGSEAIVTYRRYDPADTGINPEVARLPRDTQLNVVEQAMNPSGTELYDVRIAGPVAGWVHRYSATGQAVISVALKCPVECINCLGSFSAANEETALRFNVSNPLIKDPAARLWPENRLYKHYTCDKMGELNRGGGLIIGDLTAYHCGGYVVDVPFNESCSSVSNLIDVLRGVKWLPGGAHEPEAPFIDEVQSRFACAEYFTYCASSDTWSAIKLYIEISPAGAVLPDYQFRHFKMWTEQRQLSWTIYDFFFFAFVLYYLVKFVYDWSQCKKRTGKMLAFLIDSQEEAVWNLLDLANLVTLVVVFALRMVWWDTSMEHASKMRFPLKYIYPPHLDRIKDTYMAQVYANSVNNVLSFLKLLKYAQLNDKLGVLTLTLSKAKDKIVGVLVIFCWVVFAFSMCGESLYGSAIWGMRNLNSCYMSLMLALLGTFPTIGKQIEGEYDDLRRENRTLTFSFYWGYFILANVLLLNFIIGILAEAFSEANAEVRDVPFAEQVAKALKQLKNSLQPTQLIRSVKLVLKRTSRTAILNATIDNMRAHHKFLEAEYHGQDVELDQLEDGQIDRTKLRHFMGARDFDMLGEEFVNNLWDEIEDEFTLFINTDPELEAQSEIRDLLQSGIQAAIEPRLADLSIMDAQMSELEQGVDEIIRDIFMLRKKARKKLQTG
eukprot:TRINITY_DN9741_c0_g1_i1.p1 TRINITY_DN9741_c0_g1~~TRINITY_DN9741_c0_g1_i1.p1  ORF type:complete len:896 (+),score=301.91 TRINITY_DN9741_c0_g1_i1:146-2833(+)